MRVRNGSETEPLFPTRVPNQWSVGLGLSLPLYLGGERTATMRRNREELLGKRRHRALVTARQICMYVCRELTDLSYPSIAREFGNRDHTTVIHAVDKISKQMAERRQIYDQVTALIQDIKSA